MARLEVFTHFCLLSSMAGFLTHGSGKVQASSQTRSFAGVFLLIQDEKYTFNFTAARDACLDLNVTMATAAQMERALQHGLETCKFGWTAERVAVVPRHTSDQRCGRGKTGVVTWSASPDVRFAVFCFNTSDTLETSRVVPPSMSFPDIRTTPSVTETPPTITVTSTTSPSNRKPTTTKLSKQTRQSATSQPAHPTVIHGTAAASLWPSSTDSPPSPSQAVTSKSGVARLDVSTSGDSFVSTKAVQPNSEGSSFGVVWTGLVTLGISALLLVVAGVMWHHRLMFLSCWSKEPLKDEIETEMWKNTFSETDTQGQSGTGGEDDGEEAYGTELSNMLPSRTTGVALGPVHRSQ